MAAKRCSAAFRRHSDTDVTDNLSRIPPLHGVEDGDEIEDDWFSKLTNGNEPWALKVPREPCSTNYGLGADSIPLLTSEEPDLKQRTIKTLKVGIKKIWKRGSATITETDTTHKVAYLGNVLTGWAKGESCTEKPLNTLWKNYTSSAKPDVQMKLTVTQAGLKAVTKDHGLTEYWAHRITYCCAPTSLPRVFCWVYRHEGRKLKQELRCHAVLCAKETVARRMASTLRLRLTQALLEFKRDKLLRQNARLSLVNSVYENPSLPRRKILLSTGSHNYRPPLERSKSAPKLMSIEESLEEEENTPKAKRKLSDPEEQMATILEESEEKPNLNFYKKLCSSFENLVETTSNYGRKLRRASKEFTSRESILKKSEVEEELVKEVENEEVVMEKEAVDLEVRKEEEVRRNEEVKKEEVKKEEVDEWSDEGASSLQSVSSGGSEEVGQLDYGRELHIYKTSMERFHTYLDMFLNEDPRVETDSLSDDDAAPQEEDVVSDESGYVELVESSVRRLSIDSKEKDVPFHHIVKTCIRPIEASCLHI